MPTLAAHLPQWPGIRFLQRIARVAALTLLSALLVVLLPAHAAQQRVALVIGNSDYAVESKLANPANDAQLIARTLKSQGFAVDIKTNLPKRAMELAIAAFVRQSRRGRQRRAVLRWPRCAARQWRAQLPAARGRTGGGRRYA